ncbi:MAG: DUF357 domain-containing protein [Thermoprotei archaeon]|nr:MAG: DUF357 domain-containing protein [Thermoprotei archaeon]RLF20918.1 MAG: DUF357 domain-containing protein [Thermoprotei archaeon]
MMKITPHTRLSAYIDSVKEVLKGMKILKNKDIVQRLVNLVKAYVTDSEYYMRRGDYYTGIACISYAEGILDAMRELKLIEFKWPKRKRLPKVLVAGTFEILHPGHLYLLKKAWELGEVHVVVARDVNVAKFKGRKPVVPEAQRLEVIKNVKWVDQAYLGDEEDIFKILERVRPDIVLLGPDQPIDEETLRREIKQRGLSAKIIRLRELYKEYPLTKTHDILNKIRDLLEKDLNSN